MSKPLDPVRRARIIAAIRKDKLDGPQVFERFQVSRGLAAKLVKEARKGGTDESG